MKAITVELPEAVAKELGRLVEAGWFRSEEEAVRWALFEFMRRHRFELEERFQREDIAWALREKSGRSRETRRR